MKRSPLQQVQWADAGSLFDGSGTGREFINSPPVRNVMRGLFRALLQRIGNPPLEFALAGEAPLYTPASGAVHGRIVFREPATLWAVIRAPELAFGDAYAAGALRIEGELAEVLFHLFRTTDRAGPKRSKRSWLGRLPRALDNSLHSSRAHIHRHYDLGNDFYALWLDAQMVYTCAYFDNPSQGLEEAQIAKLDHVCRKLELRPGMQVIEAGCGWGALALHMASRYGVKVRAFNISSEQLAYARERAQHLGLSGQVQFIEDDYRNVVGECDAFVSVGMLEHVGKAHYGELGAVIARTLRRPGRALLHSVGRNRQHPPNAWIERRIFPGAYPPSLREMMDILEPYRFVVADVENLRLHYTRTLLHWLQRFDDQVERIREMYDEPFIRSWRLYLAGCAAGFRASSLQLYQVLFSHADDNDVAMTRRHLYLDTPPRHWQDVAP